MRQEMLLEKFLFEKDLENTIKSFFKPGKVFKVLKKSKITENVIQYTGIQLMDLFSIEAELEIQSILKNKFGNRVKLIGGINPQDIEIEGTSYAFNVKVASKNRIKLCSKSSIIRLKKGQEYRFIIITYNLNEMEDSIVFNNVFIINFKYLENVIQENNDIYYMNLEMIQQYTDMREYFLEGKINKFILKKSEDKKILTTEYLKNILPKKFKIHDLKLLLAKENIGSDKIQNCLEELKKEKYIIEEGTEHYIIINESLKKNSKYSIAKELYQKVLTNEIDIFIYKDILMNKYLFSKDLYRKYLKKIEEEDFKKNVNN
jgi:hypothetical protein